MTNKNKVLLMGKSGSGKTSMRSIIFANYIARDTNRIGPTVDVEHAHVRFLGNLVLHLWDCGGQEMFMEKYLHSQAEHVFKGASVLIYVFDINSNDEKDYCYYKKCIEALLKYSPTAHIFLLLHKIDLVDFNSRNVVFEDKLQTILEQTPIMSAVEKNELRKFCFMSSIWDETLYKAWSNIVHRLVPSIDRMEKFLVQFGEIIEASEILLFEKATFLVIAKAEIEMHEDTQRFEKLSNIIKQFKLSVSRIGSTFDSLQVRQEDFALFISTFTENTYIMVVVPDGSISTATMLVNINSAKKQLELALAKDGETLDDKF
uniref:GTP-binding protein n=1 Tax=Strongyloides papillosus TaxID=174720 RepID=A0A0N5BNS2_STREA